MRMPDPVEPKLVVESHGIDNQRVSLPHASGIAEPRWIQILGMAAAVHKDLPVGMYVAFDQKEDEFGSLNDFERKRSLARDTRGQAACVRIIFRQPRPCELECPGL